MCPACQVRCSCDLQGVCGFTCIYRVMKDPLLSWLQSRWDYVHIWGTKGVRMLVVDCTVNLQFYTFKWCSSSLNIRCFLWFIPSLLLLTDTIVCMWKCNSVPFSQSKSHQSSPCIVSDALFSRSLFQPVGFVTFDNRTGAEAAKNALNVSGHSAINKWTWGYPWIVE